MPETPTPEPQNAAPSPAGPTAPTEHSQGKGRPSRKAADPRVGTVLGKYLLVRLLGRGGMGVVYEAEDTLLNRRVALKVMSQDMSADPNSLGRFLQEARAAARLNHPNVVTVHEVSQIDGTYFLVMELVRGGTSAQDVLKRKGALRWPVATRIIAAACRGLMAAHEAGLIHRDIKPSNLLLAANGVVKLADFGLAKAADQPAGTGLTQLGTIVGTPDYMSPEQCKALLVTQASDLYSLGATYYALLARRPPFDRGHAIKTMFAHCSEPLEDLTTANPDIPGAAFLIIQRAMAKNPADRYPTAREMLADLEALVSQARNQLAALPDSPVEAEAGEDPTLAENSRPRNRRWLVAGALAGFLFLLGGLGIYSGLGRKAPIGPGNLKQPATGDDRGAMVRGQDGIDQPLGGTIRAMTFSPNGRLLAVGCRDGEGGLLIRDTLSNITAFRADIKIGAVAFTPDNTVVAAGINGWEEIRLLNINTGEVKKLKPQINGSITTLAFAPDGKSLFVGAHPWGDFKACLMRIDLAQPDKFVLFEEQTAPVNKIALSRSGLILVCGDTSGRASIWDTEKRRLAFSIFNPDSKTPVADLAISPDMSALAIARGKAVTFHQWDTWQKLPVAIETSGIVERIAYLADGKALATSYYRAELWSTVSGKKIRDLGTEPSFTCVAAAPDRPLIALATEKKKVQLIDGK